MPRLFIAIPVPRALRERLAFMQDGIPGARWVKPENMHITLTFIGEVDEDTAKAADEALASVRMPPFAVRLKGTGRFGRGARARLVWIGVEHAGALHKLKEATDRALARRRVPYAERRYIPHLTLARLKSDSGPAAAAFVRKHSLFSTPPFDVTRFCLVKSHPTNNGSDYEVLREYPLEPSEASGTGR